MLDYRMDTFLTVCRCMNYTKAANVLHITQPAVSQHIRYIEQEYGIRLFDFHGKKMQLTEEGRTLLNVVTTLKHDDQSLRRTFRERQTGKKQLNFGVTLTIGEYVIGEYLARYMLKYPETEVQMTIANTEELLAKLNDGEIDFALVEGFFEKSDYDCRLFRKEKYISVSGPNHPLTEKERVRMEELFEHTFVSRERGSGTREVLERALHEEGYTVRDFRHMVEISNMGAIKQMLIHGCGISFLYEEAVRQELREGTLKEIRTEGFPLYHDFNFIWRKDSLFAEEYEELLQEMTSKK